MKKKPKFRRWKPWTKSTCPTHPRFRSEKILKKTSCKETKVQSSKSLSPAKKMIIRVILTFIVLTHKITQEGKGECFQFKRLSSSILKSTYLLHQKFLMTFCQSKSPWKRKCRTVGKNLRIQNYLRRLSCWIFAKITKGVPNRLILRKERLRMNCW